MLEKLDSVGWSGLTHAYGTAEEIPAFIAALRSPDAEVRAEALDELWSCLLHEGLRFEADAYAVPFLADLAVDPATADRPVILHLLTAMAIGSDHPYLVTGFPIGRLRPSPDAVDESWHLLYSEWSGRTYDGRAPEGSAELRVYDAVRVEVPRIVPLLADPDGAVAEAAAYLLAWFPEQARTTVGPLVDAAFRGGLRRDARVSALLAAGLAARTPGPALSAGLELLSDPDGEVRWAAAASWALACGAAAPEEVRVVLRTRAEVRSDHDEPWLAPWGMRRAEWSVRLLERIGDPAGAEIRRRLVEAATAQPRSGGWAEHLAEPFYLAFGDDERTGRVPFERLTPAQSWLVEHLAGHPEMFTADGEQLDDLLRWYGLPTGHGLLAAYASAR
ncbi:hypothetical protein [Catellatospora bangladeshensis]|uniref:HEAT repeat domain-containing protein n=1 Tax=Catellatospora bangladeshensis TaxID=310355 RepID=A0A8J3JHE6_9ACTN|nr:hypothetical protein [Catellatospora bangladeshensis]GIF80542.1 hypothetical protein Cba03nite_18910 [Catellatospora bangladeshensis]